MIWVGNIRGENVQGGNYRLCPPLRRWLRFFPSFLADDHSFVVLRRLAAGSIVYKRGTHSRTHALLRVQRRRSRQMRCGAAPLALLLLSYWFSMVVQAPQPRAFSRGRSRKPGSERGGSDEGRGGEGNAGAGCARSNVYYPGSQAARCTRAAALARGDIEQRLRAVPRSCWLGGVYGDVRIREWHWPR